MHYEWIRSTPEQPWIIRDVPPACVDEASLKVLPDPGQTWKGFGGCFNELGWIALSKLAQEERDAVLRGLFSNDPGCCGFSYCRMPIGASDYARSWYSHNEHDGDYAMEHFSIERDHRHLIPYIRAAQQYQPGLSLFASPWSPPTWMKSPPAYNYGTLVWTPENLTAYARYFVRFVQAYAALGMEISAVHVQNEPNSDQKFPSCVWTGAQMRDFIRDYLGPAFRDAGLSTQVWVGTIERADINAWAQLILSDAKAHTYVSGVGYQWAGKGAVQRQRMAWPDVPIIQTENECGDGTNTWDYAHYIFDLIHHYVTNGVEAYVYWNMVLEDGGESTWGWKQNAMVSVDPLRGTYTLNPEYYVMRHVAGYVEPGDSVLGLEGHWAGNALAFRKRDGRMVWTLHNPFEDEVTVSIDGGRDVYELRLDPRSFHTVITRQNSGETAS